MKKINRTQAEKLYNAGKMIKVIPCKMNPENIWQKPFEISNHDETDELDFNKRITAYEYYNCNNETGKYSAFYVDD